MNEIRLASRGRFLRHFLEMVVAMVVGMILGPVWDLVSAPLGWSDVLDRTEPSALVMATNMSIGMSLWMRYRRHSWVSIAEMSAAMYVPFVILFVPLWLGAIGGDAVLVAGHLLMLPAMALVMRPDEYAHGHRSRAHRSTDDHGNVPA